MLTKEEIALLEATSSQLASRPIDGGLVRKAVAHIREQDAALAEARELIEWCQHDCNNDGSETRIRRKAVAWLRAFPAPAKEK